MSTGRCTGAETRASSSQKAGTGHVPLWVQVALKALEGKAQASGWHSWQVEEPLRGFVGMSPVSLALLVC